MSVRVKVGIVLLIIGMVLDVAGVIIGIDSRSALITTGGLAFAALAVVALVLALRSARAKE